MRKLRPREENKLREQELEPECPGFECSVMPPGPGSKDVLSVPPPAHIPGSHEKCREFAFSASAGPPRCLPGEAPCGCQPPPGCHPPPQRPRITRLVLPGFFASCLLKVRLLASGIADVRCTKSDKLIHLRKGN